MASAALDILVSKLSETLFSMAKEELARQMGLVDDVETLRGTLEELQGYLLDAEKKSIEDVSTNRWLHQIKDAIYDIEDVLDEYALEVDEIAGSDKRSSSTKPGFINKLLSTFKKAAPKRRISIEIQGLNNKLKEIMNQIPRLALIRSIYSSSSSNQMLANQAVVHDKVTNDIVGRRIHDDCRRLVELLIKEDDRDNNPLVYAIVGIGGIGKTTLAKLIFDDSIIKSHFDVKVWTSISHNSSDINVLRSIVESISGKEHGGHNANLLCEKFKDMVNGKRLFVVLDDVWEVESVWNRSLKSLVKSGAARGSRVLVTTRNNEVADKMMAVSSHSVELLAEEDGWLLLCKAAFPALKQNEGGDDILGLKDVGIEFVKKCNGLPLAINAIGGILLTESRTREAWASVLKNSLWEVKGLPADIHTALYMSYQYLPSHIKQCFLYFSLIPRGLFYKSLTASEQWMQEGFIKEENNISVYDVGENILRLLVRRNLLMYVPVSLEESFYIMHDLLRALSQFLVQNESRLVEDEEELLRSTSRNNHIKLRRLSYVGGGRKTTETFPRCLVEQTSLRTLLVFDQTISRIDNDLFNHLHRLRILSLQGTSITELPASVGTLTLLGHLNLASTLISKLPETIENLKCLRVLNVARCINLFNLPPCIVTLHRLHCLATSESALTHLPPGLGKLHQLQILDFTPSIEHIATQFSSLKELDLLKKLRRLFLHKLERVLDPLEARSANIKSKDQLETFKLACSKSEFNAHLYSPKAEELADRLEKVFEELCPPPQLRKLYIIDYFGSQFPTWLSRSPFNLLLVNLRSINLMGCSNCNKLPGLGILRNLEELEIGFASSVKCIDPEFYTGNIDTEKSIIKEKHQNPPSDFTSGGPFFPKLKLLHIKNMDNLEEWTSPGKGISIMPRIETLLIRGCPKLRSLPEEFLCHSTSLKMVIIEGADKLSFEAVEDDPFLEILVICWIGNLERISNLPSLQVLSLLRCPGLILVDVKNHLEKLIWGDFTVDMLPRWLSAGNLKASFLEIKCSDRLLTKLCFKDKVGNQEFSKIQHYDNISAWDRNQLLRLSYSKDPYNFTVHPPTRFAN